jgi:hypothetical protein
MGNLWDHVCAADWDARSLQFVQCAFIMDGPDSGPAFPLWRACVALRGFARRGPNGEHAAVSPAWHSHLAHKWRP